MIEIDEKLPAEAFIKTKAFKDLFIGFNISIKTSVFYKQQLTHQTIEGLFLHVTADAAYKKEIFTALKKAEIKTLAFPRFITGFLEKQEELRILKG